MAKGEDMVMSGVLGRLEEVLQRENALIGTDSGFDISASNTQKSRCLYELNLLFQSPGGARPSEETRARLSRLRETLEINTIRVKAHLEAVRGVTDLINDAMQAAEADGTYSAEQFRTGAA